MTITVRTRAEGKATAELDEDGFREYESRCDLPCGCSRFGDGPGCATARRCDAHHDFQEAVNAEIAAIRAENAKIRESLEEAVELLDLVAMWRIYGVNPRYREWKTKALRALKEAEP